MAIGKKQHELLMPDLRNVIISYAENDMGKYKVMKELNIGYEAFSKRQQRIIKLTRRNLENFKDLRVLLRAVRAPRRDIACPRVYLKPIHIETILAYAENGMSIKRTAAEIFLSYNAVFVRLRRIREITGLDPKKFNELCVLYDAAKKYGG